MNTRLSYFETDWGLVKEAPFLRVAAYIRVSSEHKNQEDSYEMQKAYFEELLAVHPGWMMAGVYADYGISGTSREKRTGFTRLMRHCKEGKIDRIITKSISRFCRNTRDFLSALQICKDYHITIYFEKERLDTAIAQNEAILTAFGAIAQEESRSISANIRWGNQKRYQRGEVQNIPLYGYRYADGPDACEKTSSGYTLRRLVIEESEASVVRNIFQEAAAGKHFIQIARELNFRQIPPPQSRFTKKRIYNIEETPPGMLYSSLVEGWTGEQIGQILRLERYAGDVRTTKTYIPDYKTHKVVSNKGEREQYYVKNHHPAIIDRTLFETVQIILKRNSEKLKNRDSRPVRYPFTGRLVCRHCGRFYRTRNRAHAPIWYCPTSSIHNGKQLCKAEKIYEEQLISMCKKAVIDRYHFQKITFQKTPDAKIQPNIPDQKTPWLNPDFKVHWETEKEKIQWTARDETLLETLQTQLEKVQLADTFEHDRIFLQQQIRKCPPEQESRRKELEKQLKDLECYWHRIEEDYQWRQKAIDWMKTLPKGSRGFTEFLNGLTGEYAKAFLLFIEVDNPCKYRIHWFDDTWTDVAMDPESIN